jgi:hypothetical protein
MDYSLLVAVKRKTFFVANEPSSLTHSMSGADLSSIVSHHPPPSFHQQRTNTSNLRSSLASAPSLNGSNNNSFIGGTPGSARQSTAIAPVSVDSLHSHSPSLTHHQQQTPSSAGSGVTFALDSPSSMFRVDEPFAIHAAAVEGAGSFSFGIIDSLQEWNWIKWYERVFKIWFLGKDAEGLSAIDPRSYRKRFIRRAVLDIFAAVDYIPSTEIEGTDGKDFFNQEIDRNSVLSSNGASFSRSSRSKRARNSSKSPSMKKSAETSRQSENGEDDVENGGKE